MKVKFFTHFFCFLLCVIVNSCTANHTDKQFLLYANYLSQTGLGNPVYLMNAVKHDKIKSIGFDFQSNKFYDDFLKFNENGDLESISQFPTSDTKLNYNDKHKLMSIENALGFNYYGIFEPEKIDIMYDKKGFPIYMIFTRKTKMDTVLISFNKRNGEYLIRRNIKRHFDGYVDEFVFFDQYNFKDNKIVAEYHRNRFYDSYIDSTLYVYNKNKLTKNIRHDDRKTITVTEYDDLSRPITETCTYTYPNESITWIEKYYYESNNFFPSKIETIYPNKDVFTKYIKIKKWE